jgi:hypothetical protein
VQALTTVDDLHREGLASDIHQGLMVLQGNIADNWRCQQHLAAALLHLPNLLGPDVLAEQWAPYAFGLLLNGKGGVCRKGMALLAASVRAQGSVGSHVASLDRLYASCCSGALSQWLWSAAQPVGFQPKLLKQHHDGDLCICCAGMPAGAAAVKPAAARGLASLLRSCRRDRPRTDMYCRIMRELAWGKSCFARLAFIQVCCVC